MFGPQLPVTAESDALVIAKEAPADCSGAMINCRRVPNFSSLGVSYMWVG